MEKRESYRNNLPHFQQPGQAYFLTWTLHEAIPPKALVSYTRKLEMLKSQMGDANSDSRTIRRRESEFASPVHETEIDKLMLEYYSLRKKYIKAYDDLLDSVRNPAINLAKSENTEIIIESLQFWEGKRLKNLAFCIMPNHIHWVVELLEKDNKEQLVYLQDILQSVKRFSSSQINKLENRGGALWQRESFDTTIRDEKHLYYAISYTLNNPVKAGLVSDWRDWKGTWNGYREF